MRRRQLMILCAILSLMLGGCTGENPTPNPQEGTPTPLPIASATALPASEATTTATARLTGGCTLLNSRDVAKLFPTAEVVQPTYAITQANHLVFSNELAQGTEVSCMYLAFYKPTKKDNQMLQVTYWMDVPAQPDAGALERAWADAKSRGIQPISGVGDDAFYNNSRGRLTFKKGRVYVTIEILGTNLDTSNSEGVRQQIDMEKQIALAALTRLQ